MALDLSLAPLLNAIGALLVAIVGAWILALSRGKRRIVLLGGLCIAFGLTLAMQNILVRREGTSDELVFLGASLSTSVLAILLAREEVRDLPARFRRRGLAFTVVLFVNATIAAGVTAASVQARPDRGFTFSVLVVAHFILLPAALTLLLWAGASRLQGGTSATPAARRATACIALAFGMYNTLSNLEQAALGAGFDATTFVLGFLSILAVAAFIPVARSPEPQLLRRSILALVAAGVSGIVIASVTGDPSTRGFGIFGVVRTIGAFLLALAVLKYDLLGRAIRPTTARRGVIAAGALATLFIVAQIAQNFFTDAYGVLIGGIIAGAFLFAASPIQRLAERAALGRSAPTGADAIDRSGQREGGTLPTPKADDARAHRIYERALRAAIGDGRITPGEEEHLAHIAHELGITHPDALRIRRAVEAEQEVR